MLHRRVIQVACWVLIASFAIGGRVLFSASMEVDSVNRFDNPAETNPNDDDSPISPVNSIPEDSTDTSGSDSIPPLARSLAIIYRDMGAYHSAPPSVFYSLHARNELLRPPCV